MGDVDPIADGSDLSGSRHGFRRLGDSESLDDFRYVRGFGSDDNNG